MSFGLSHKRELDVTGVGLHATDLPPYERGRIHPGMFFDHSDRPLEIEIGSGKGTFLVQEAPRQPSVNFLGIEWTGEFFRYAADRARRHALSNVRVLHADATEFIQYWCAESCVRVVHLYFSDPWPKSRHHKRRVIQDATLAEFHRILEPQGELRLVTDHDDLWTWYEDHAERNANLFERKPFAPPESAAESGEIVGSNFERKYKREGRPFHAMTLVKRAGEQD